MTYQIKADAYADPQTRARIDVCCTEQAYVFINDARSEFIQLADRVIAREPLPLDALAAGVCAGPNGANLHDDGALLGAVQAIWPTVANALYIAPPDPEPEPEL